MKYAFSHKSFPSGAMTRVTTALTPSSLTVGGLPRGLTVGWKKGF